MHYAIDISTSDGSEFLLSAFYQKEWNKTVIDNFFNAFNEDILTTIDQLKLIEFKLNSILLQFHL
jgi:hypothetical protein